MKEDPPSVTAYTHYSTLTRRLSRGPGSLFWYKTPHRLPQAVSGPQEEICQALGNGGREAGAPAGTHFPRRPQLLDKALKQSPAMDGDTGGFVLGMSTSVYNFHFFTILKDQSCLC